MTVKELKGIIDDWPEKDSRGNDNEVWISTGRHKSSEADKFIRLNDADLLLYNESILNGTD